MNFRALLAALSLIGLLLTVTVYLPALDAGFYFDDLPNILEPPGIHWTSFSLANIRKLFSSTMIPRRFIANFSFALNHLFGGLEPRGYHLVNILIHLAVGFALAWTSVLITTAPDWEDKPSSRNYNALLAAVVPTIIFLVHPLNIQTVTYVVQRMTSMATLFSLLAFSCYLMGRRSPNRRTSWMWFVLSSLSWILALGSKEIALALPLLIVTYEGCFHRAHWQERLNLVIAGNWRTRLVLLFAGLFVLGLGIMFLNAYVGKAVLSIPSLSQQFPKRNFNGLERVLTQPRVQIFYLSLLLWPAPSRLNLDHDFFVSRSLLEPPSTIFAVLFWIALSVGAIFLVWKRPRYGFPLLAYLELHLIESGPINLELVFEHRMYFPMTALAVLLTLVLVELPTRQRRAGMALALGCTLPLAALTYARNMTWSDPIAFHYDCAKKSPNKFRPQYNLGTILGKQGRVLEAIPPLEKAIALDPVHSEAHNQFGNALLLTNKPRDALIHYQSAVRLKPDNVEAVYNLAMVLDHLGNHREAVEYYHRFLSIAPPTLAQHVAAARRRIIFFKAQAPKVRRQEHHGAQGDEMLEPSGEEPQ